MKKQLQGYYFLILYFIFWLFICWLDRFFFLLYASPASLHLDALGVLNIYWNGLILDLSMAAYVCALPFLLYMIWSFFSKLRLSRIWINLYTGLVLAIVTILTLINVNLYPEWKDKVSKRAIDAFFETPAEALSSADSSAFWIAPVVILTIFVGGLLLYKFAFRKAFEKIKISYLTVFFHVLLGSFFLFSCIRGGYGTSPLNESMAYFSTQQYVNHAAVNTYWSFINDYVQSGQTKNPYAFFANKTETDQQVKPIFDVNQDSAYSILTTTKPNVVLLVLESFTADLVGNLGAEKGITPHLDRLLDEGVSFTNFYAASDRSDKGIIGIFSAFPAQGRESIIKSLNKHEGIPGIGQEIKAAGYHTSFYYGGQSEFYNFKSYMLSHGMDKVIDAANFDLSDFESSWGVYDEKVFDRMLVNLRKEQSPFLSSIFTISNHEPFDLKGTYKYGNKTTVDKFKSTAYYTDSVINDFLNKAKKESWYANTLFVITADHGHRLPMDREITEAKRFQIPLLFYGEVLKKEFRGKKMNKVGGQVDIAATLLGQLGLSSAKYPWSRDLFNSTTPAYALFNTKNAIGIVAQDGFLVIDGKSQDVLSATGNSAPLGNMLKAYNQQVFDHYLTY